MPAKIHLVVIDPQNDFCLEPSEGAALSVGGAKGDMNRLAAMIDRIGDKLEDIHVTLDTHHQFDVAHPMYWKNSSGQNPAPFTVITAKDVADGVWTPTVPSLYQRSVDYVRSLETNKRYPLMIWPPHCLIGTPGHNVYAPLLEQLLKWEVDNRAMVDYITKGSNPYTEHYSAIKADVPDPADVTTKVNIGFIETLENADLILIAGEASSHCVANTLRDVVNEFSNKECAKKIMLLTDAMSPVYQCEQLQNDFFAEMKSYGVQFGTTTDILK